MIHPIRELHVHRFSVAELKKNQLHELYIAMMLKTLGLSLIGVFIPVYLYQLGYTVEVIALFYAFIFAVRAGSDLLAAWLTGYFGPKHMMILSHIFLVISLSMFLTLETTNWPLVLIGSVHAIATGFFFISYHIEFSKLQSAKHGGSQISVMYRVGKFASAIGPLLGGAIATIANVQVAIVTALVFIMASALPLSLGPEPVRTRQHVTWRDFPWRKAKWDLISNASLPFDQMASIILWPLYVSIFVFTENVYLNVGIITSLGLFVSVLAAAFFGRLIDANKGRTLLTVGVGLQSLVHGARSVVSTSLQVFGLNFVADSITSAVRMPYTKGLYGAASSHEGYRDAYIGTVMSVSNFLRAGFFLILVGLMQSNSIQLSMQIMFVLAAFIVWGTLLQRFKALR